MSDETKKCPFCQETIDLNEIKCPYCGEELNNPDTKKDSETKNNKVIIIAVVSSIILLVLLIAIACVALFVVKPQYENKAIIEAFKNSFQKTYPNLSFSFSDLNFDKLNILSQNDEEAIYSIAVSNKENGIEYTFIYNRKMNEISQITPYIPSCNMLMEQDSTKITYSDYLRNLAEENSTFRDSQAGDYYYSNEYISYLLLTKASEIKQENITEKDNTKTSIACEADTVFTFKRTLYKKIKAKSNIKFKQCEDKLAFCAEVNYVNNFTTEHKTESELNDIVIDMNNAKPYLKEYLEKALSEVRFQYYMPYEDKTGEYIFDIAKDGTVMSATVYKSAEQGLDNIVIDAFKKREKIKPLPDKYPEEVLTVKLKIPFKGRYSSSNFYNNSSFSSDSSDINLDSNNLNGTSGVDTIAAPDFGPYMKDIQRRIKMNWDPPKGTESKRVELLFKIAKNGRLLSCTVYKSSGFPAADKAAINAVYLTAPFKPLPTSFKGSSVDIQFTFDYNEK